MENPKILVVDDEVSILNLFVKAFSHYGYEVRTATNSEKALATIDDQDIQVMFLDLNMPEMDGVELCRQIKKKRPLSVIYAMTGYASLFDLAACLEAGFEDYFKKPVNLSLLNEAAQHAFNKIDRWKKS